MRSHYRAIAIAIALAATATATAYAQSGSTAGSNGTNALGRGDDVIFHSPFNRGQPSAFGRGGLDSGINRQGPRKNTQVTPVPEPSQWAMLVAGLALVGFIARRNSRKSRDAS